MEPAWFAVFKLGVKWVGEQRVGISELGFGVS